MPNHEEHCAESLKRYGKTFSELHTWMDEPCLILGSQHRIYRHDPYVTPVEARAIFGVNADNACLDHILLDRFAADRNVITQWVVNPTCLISDSVQPVIRFTIKSQGEAWRFKSEAFTFLKEDKIKFSYHPEEQLQSKH
jgi:hypothetical protein